MVTITKSQLIADVESGLKRPEIAEKYGLPLNQVQKLMKIAGLKTKRANNLKFKFIDDTTIVSEPESKAPYKAPYIDVEIVDFNADPVTGEIPA